MALHSSLEVEEEEALRGLWENGINGLSSAPLHVLVSMHKVPSSVCHANDSRRTGDTAELKWLPIPYIVH